MKPIDWILIFVLAAFIFFMGYLVGKEDAEQTYKSYDRDYREFKKQDTPFLK